MKTNLLKRIATATIAFAMLSGVAAAATGCGNNSAVEYTITFNYNYDGASVYLTQKVQSGKTATEPTKPEREGYSFDDWYQEALCTNPVDFSAVITGDVTYYAGWSADNVNVTFDFGYDGQTQAVSVVPGNTVAQPQEPERSGYAFEGWYADSGLTETFDFSAPITENTTVYANWIEVDESKAIITYMWNYGSASVYKRETIDKESRLTVLPTAEREGYLLSGWYLDSECTSLYSSTSYGRITENLTLYARWYTGFVFEAEYTDLNDEYDEPRQFYGFSSNMAGEQAIESDATATASNGYYLGNMYIMGAYLYFDIVSDAAINDAVLYVSLGLEEGFGSTASITSSDFVISVNGTALDYSDISLSYAPIGTITHSTFGEYKIGNISLTEGTNTIRLEVNNNIKGSGGTQSALAPLVDSITVYSGTQLSWDPVTSNVR